jgi:hypothetical protein
MTAFAGHWPADSADHNHVAWVPGACEQRAPTVMGQVWDGTPPAARSTLAHQAKRAEG